MHRFVLLVSLPLLLHVSDLRAQTRKPIGTPAEKTAGQQIPSTEMFSFENCVVENEYIYWQRGHDQLVRVQREDGKYPQTLITTNTQIGNFALDGNEVYYVTENKNESSGTSSSYPLKGELRKVDLTNGSIKTVFADFDYPADQFIRTDSTHIYFLGGSKEGIVVWRLEKSGGQPQRLVSGLQHPMGFVVDEKNVYWCDYGNNSVQKVAKTGGEPIVLFDGNEYRAVPVSMTSDERLLFLLDQSGNIYQIDKDSGKAKKLFTNSQAGFDETVPISADHDSLFWPLGNRVMRMSKNGGNATVVSLRTSPARCVVADDKYVYWSEWKKGLMKLAK
jgi:hypothetical protein